MVDATVVFVAGKLTCDDQLRLIPVFLMIQRPTLHF